MSGRRSSLIQSKKVQIVYNPDFTRHFNHIWDHIADDNIVAANRFKKQLKTKLEQLPIFPYKFRKSFYYQDEHIRDYIFKGYTVPYLIDTSKNQILILDLFKWIDK